MSDCIKTLASCQFHAYFRAGRMPTLLLFSAKIQRGTGILPVSCLFSGGQDAHSTPIQREDSATPKNL
ncbi:hypothetical protein BJP36_40655 [Moorena producens JHB]|uniref:Uncharacterized protein n=1 Tax=Moorena producens (strain JHB) TaxID=1454205 RepID=A0A9Q9SS82_MOOP1|nr:hypothetical protein [Moorena producens]WAN68682.1 hypothetical protein BJP36_40655 [Moorena producens JHB]